MNDGRTVRDEHTRDIRHETQDTDSASSSLSPDLPGSSFPACAPGEYGHCATCADEAQQVRVLSVDAVTGFALAEVNGVTGEVDISLVEDLAPGDFILI